ncbi:hypothetical protein SP41_75 [Salmonella phage 41]|nr:hypothetical protein SP41_75 [Salmonella phage 41]
MAGTQATVKKNKKVFVDNWYDGCDPSTLNADLRRSGVPIKLM